MARQILVDWSYAGSPGGVSVFHFIEDATPAAQRAALDAFLGGFADRLATTTAWAVRSTGNEFDPADGSLTGVWADPTAADGGGTAAGLPLANATQVLVQWHTGLVRRRRLVRGRTFIPGFAQGSCSASGNLASATYDDVTANAALLVLAGVGLAVWARPIPASAGAPAVSGSIVPVTSSSVWREFAVQRGRR